MTTSHNESEKANKRQREEERESLWYHDEIVNELISGMCFYAVLKVFEADLVFPLIGGANAI